jgi:hypothetical protein
MYREDFTKWKEYFLEYNATSLPHLSSSNHKRCDLRPAREALQKVLADFSLQLYASGQEKG